MATETTNGESPDKKNAVEPTAASNQPERIEDLLNRLTRAQADLANLKRRSAQELADARQFVVIGFARELLSALDHLDRALGAVPEELAGFSFIEGLFFTRQHFQALLAANSIEPIAGSGEPFDPKFHQAVDTDGSSDPDRVVAVYQAGYRVGDRVVRPALVRVGGSTPGGAETESGVATDAADAGDSAAAESAEAEG